MGKIPERLNAQGIARVPAIESTSLGFTIVVGNTGNLTGKGTSLPTCLSARISGSLVGLIAQEVEKVLSEVVTTNSDGYKSICYDNLAGIFVESIKAQQGQIDLQKSIITSQGVQIEELKQRLSKLEKLIGK